MAQVAVLMGSSSDLPKIQSCLDTLKKLDVAFEVRVMSAHRTPDVVKEYSDTVASGKVIRQNPPANSSAQEGDTVTITVSKGRRPVKVPNVVGKSLSDANNTLEAAGLRPTYKLKESDEVPEDCVISQSPVGGASAYQNDTVTIVISSGSSR